MLLKDLYETTTDVIDNKNDNSIAKKSDTRKTKLTLEKINQLRKLEDRKISEYYSSLEKVKKQYGPAEEEAAPAV